MIKIETHNAKGDQLFAQSKWWGQPDMPDGLDYPQITLSEDDETWDDPLTFICQLRCDQLAQYDPDGLLPHEGMLYFFAALDYYFGDIDTLAYPGMGEWGSEYFKVLYSPTCDNLHTHRVVGEDGEPINIPAESISFSFVDKVDADPHMLGRPYMEEVQNDMPDMINLLQVDESDEWHLTFHDCGMLNFLINPNDLKQRRFDKAACYLFSF